MNGASEQRQRALSEAQQQLQRGDWRAAARQLERAAQLADAAGDATRAAHCWQMAAALQRARGESGKAVAAAGRAGKLAESDPRARFAARAELGEALIAEGDFTRAAEAYRAALDDAVLIELPAWARATVRRRLAEADAGRGASEQAWLGYDVAAQEMIDVGDPLAAAWIDIEHANCARQAGAVDHAQQVGERPGLALLAAAAPQLASERLLLTARLQADRGCFAKAADAAAMARSKALEAFAPLSYYGAAVALAEALEGIGQRTDAYAALATAWATLGDLLGREVAESWVLPIIEAYRVKWGSGGFSAAKCEHDGRRRKAILAAREGQ